MKIFNLVLFLVAVGCGDINGDINVGKDEAKTKEEEKKTETSATPSATSTTSTTTETEVKEEDTATVIYEGMSKKNVERILGKPSSVTKNWDEGIKWIYLEHNMSKICVYIPVYSMGDCSVTFNSEGEMTGQEDVQAKWLQL